MAQPRTRSYLSRLLGLLTGCLVAFAASGCATLERHAACGLVGAGAATAGSIVYVASEDFEAGETVGIVAGGMVGGAVLGYGACIIVDMVQNK